MNPNSSSPPVTTSVRHLLALVALAAVMQTGSTPSRVQEGSLTAQISFEVPGSWTVTDEAELVEQGFVVTPGPPYALVASPAPKPSMVVLAPSSVPWLFVTVESDPEPVPPAKTYQLVPQYLEALATQNGYSVIGVKTLAPPRPVDQGGLGGSTAAMMVVASSYRTSFDELTYEKGEKLWLIVAGCSAPCYNSNQATITQIVQSVRVGTAAAAPAGSPAAAGLSRQPGG